MKQKQKPICSVSERAYNLILKKIEDANKTKTHQLPSEPEMAIEYGVSRVTIRRVLAQMEAERLIDRQKGRGTFIRPQKTSGKICILYNDHANIFQPWISGILRGITDICAKHNRQLQLQPLPIWGEKGLVKKLISNVHNHTIDGYIILLRLHLDDCHKLLDANIPAVWVEQNYKCNDIPSVLANHAAAAEDAIKHLTRNSNNNIALISGPMGTETNRKADIILNTMKRILGNKAPVTGKTHIITNRTIKEGKQAALKLLKRKTSYSILTTDDSLAVGMIHALTQLYDSPKKYPAIVSYVTPNTYLKELLPWYTIESIEPELLGIKAITMLEKLMMGQKLE